MDRLPCELVCKILSYLSEKRDLCHCSFVCKLWKDVVWSSLAWEMHKTVHGLPNSSTTHTKILWIVEHCPNLRVLQAFLSALKIDRKTLDSYYSFQLLLRACRNRCKESSFELCHWLQEATILCSTEVQPKELYLCLAAACSVGNLSVCEWLRSTFKISRKIIEYKQCYLLAQAAAAGRLEVHPQLRKTRLSLLDLSLASQALQVYGRGGSLEQYIAAPCLH